MRSKIEKQTSDGALPNYAPTLALRHRAFVETLKKIVADCPIPEGSRILDLACGDGTYTALLAQHAPRQCDVVGLDASTQFLKLANDVVKHAGARDSVELMQGDAFDLPFPDDEFDVVWCAHSMISLQPPTRVLREMMRVARPGGMLVVIENDEVHSLILSWPADVELSVFRALHQALKSKDGSLDDRCFARRGLQTLHQLGFCSVQKRIYPTNLDGPLEPVEEACLRTLLAQMWQQASPFLSADERSKARGYLDPEHNQTFLESPTLEATWQDYVFFARCIAPAQ